MTLLLRRGGLVPRLLPLLLLFVVLPTARPAAANPRPLPFTYQHEQLGQGSSEVEQFVDFTPVRVRTTSDGSNRWYGFTQFQTEFEHGLTDRLELGLYVTFVPGIGSGFSELPIGAQGTGMKQRLRYRLAPTGEWPIDLGLYAEVVENERELELEGKVIAQRRLGPVRGIVNFTLEREFYYDGRHDIVLEPSAGLTFEASPQVQPGIEWWMRSEYPEENPPSPRPFQLGPQHYIGPVAMFQFGKLWWSAGAYLRLNRPDHTMTPGDAYGRVWVRSVLGFSL